MKKLIGILVSAIGLLLLQSALAQGTLYLSNLNRSPTGSGGVGSDAWVAQIFYSGTNSGGYTLNSIQLLMDPASGSPSGFAISIYSSLAGVPGSSLGSLNGSDPATGGIFSYTASGIMLSPSTEYFVVVTATTPVAQGSYYWSAANYWTATNTLNYDSGGHWFFQDKYFTSSDGSSWAGHIREDNLFQLAVDGTAVPEPETYVLLGLGLAALSFWRRKP